MSLSLPYSLGVQAGLEKLGVSDTAITAGTAFLSPTLSGLTAEDGRGLQTSLSGLAGSLIGKKLLKSDIAGRLLGSVGATAASKAGGGLVSPDPEEIRQMKRRGDFSWWDYGTRGLRTMGMGAGLGGLFALGGGIPAAAMAAAGGAGRGAFSGFVISPMMREAIRGGKALYRGDEAYHDKMKKKDYYDFKRKEPYYHAGILTATHPNVREAIADTVTGARNE